MKLDLSKTCYNWHPLYKYFLTVKVEYIAKVNANYIKGVIASSDAFNLLKDYNFSNWLEYLGEDCTAEDIFKPLQMTCFNHFVLFKYKSMAEIDELGYDLNDFFYLYDGLYQECRSVVFDTENDSIVLAPQKKFKNVGEDSFDWSLESIQNRINSPDTVKVEIMNKLDGSNQNYCYLDGYNLQSGIFGAGSQGLDWNESWRLKNGYDIIFNNYGYEDMMYNYPNSTFCFEYISPDNAIVVQYTKEQEGLYLFAIRDNTNGKELPLKNVIQIAQEYDVPVADFYDTETLDSIMEKTGDYSANEKEGWVIRITDKDGDIFKAKLKCDDYVQIHKVLSKNISPNAVIKAVADGNYDDFISKVPKSYQDMVSEYAKVVMRYKQIKEELITFHYENVLKSLEAKGLENIPENKKEYMLEINRVPSKVKEYVRQLYFTGLMPEVLRTKKGALYAYPKMNEIKSFLASFEQFK